MAKYSGISGDVTITGGSGTWAAGIVTNNIRRWESTITRNLVDSTSKSDAGNSTDVYGVTTGEGTIVMAADDTTALALTAGTDPTVTLTLKGSRNISGAAKIMSLQNTGQSFTPPGELAEVTFRFRFQGAITIA